MNKLLTHRILTMINFGIVVYFMLIYVLNFFEISHVLIGFFRELLTIPFLLAQIIFLFVGIIFLAKNKVNYLTLTSVLALAVCSFITIVSFF